MSVSKALFLNRSTHHVELICELKHITCIHLSYKPYKRDISERLFNKRLTVRLSVTMLLKIFRIQVLTRKNENCIESAKNAVLEEA